MTCKHQGTRSTEKSLYRYFSKREIKEQVGPLLKKGIEHDG